MNPKSLFSAGLILLLGSGLFQPFKPELPEARADEAVALIQPGETGPTLATTEASANLADFSPYRWHTFYGGESPDYGVDITAAGDGSVYITGTSVLSWLGDGGAEPLHPYSGSDDLFVLKVDSQGSYQWHTFYGGGSWDWGFNIAVGGDGSVYIMGTSFESWLGDGGAEPLHPFSPASDLNFNDFFVLTLDSEGAYQWHTFYGSEWGDYGYGIAAVGEGSIYITGSSDLSWLGDGGAEPLHPHSGNGDITVLKLDSEGAYQWHTFYGGGSWDYGYKIAVGGDGSVYVPGQSNGSWLGDGGAEPLHPFWATSSPYYNDIFVLKLDSEGAYQWHTFYGGEYFDGSSGIAVAGEGIVYITGSSEQSWLGDGDAEPINPRSGYGNRFVLKLDSEGAYQWHTFYGGEYSYIDSFIAVAGEGIVYLTGTSYLSWLGDGGAEPLHPHSGMDDLFVLKLDSEGAYQWHTFYGSVEGDYGYGIAAVGEGSVYITGSSDRSWLGDGGAEPLHPHSGYHELFILKLGIQDRRTYLPLLSR
jgi:hypothetical protein